MRLVPTPVPKPTPAEDVPAATPTTAPEPPAGGPGDGLAETPATTAPATTAPSTTLPAEDVNVVSVEVGVEAAWLSAPGREFPVTVDPALVC